MAPPRKNRLTVEPDRDLSRSSDPWDSPEKGRGTLAALRRAFRSFAFRSFKRGDRSAEERREHERESERERKRESERERKRESERERDWYTARGDLIQRREGREAPRRSSRFAIFLLAGFLILFIVAAVAIYFYRASPGAVERLFADGEPLSLLSEPFDLYRRPYLPRLPQPSQGKSAAMLYRAGQLYHRGEERSARLEFERILQGGGGDDHKAIALIYLGAMDLQLDHFARARHNFLRASRYDPRSAASYINLAILEQRLGQYRSARRYALRAQELEPGNERLALLLGNLLAVSQERDAAIRTYEQALEEGGENWPADPLLLYNLALAHLDKGDVAAALRYFERLIAKEQGNEVTERAHALMGGIYFDRGSLRLAREHFQAAQRLSPANARYLYNLGAISMHLKERGRAKDYFRQALGAGSADLSAWRHLARGFSRIGEEGLALQALERGLEQEPGNIALLFETAQIRVRLGDLALAARDLRRIVNTTPGDRNSQEALLRLAKVYIELERREEATDALERLLALRPDTVQGHYLLGKIHRHEGRIDLAVRSWRRALNLGRGVSPAPQEEQDLRLALAEAYRSEGAYQLALEQYLQAWEKSQGGGASLALGIGDTYLAMGDHAKAVSYLEQISSLRNAAVRERIAAFQKLTVAYSKQGRRSEARASINKAVHLDSLDPETRLLQSSILIESDSPADREKALEILTAVAESDLSAAMLSQAYNLIGLAQMKEGSYRRAQSSFDYALKLDPANEEAYRNQQSATRAYEGSL